ncbi:MAG: hypothetical protein JW982_14770 [Spirochaetes bacterium]|nr:hypothetical protein [Spirochaetota bacterium]
MNCHIMTFERSNFGFFITFLIVGAFLGYALGTLIVSIIPAARIITMNLTDAASFDLNVISVTIRLSISAIIGCIAGFLIYLKI